MKAWCWVLGVVVFAQAAVACGDSAGDGGDAGGSGGKGTSGSSGTGTTGGTTSTGGGGQVPESPLCEPFAMHVSTSCPDVWTYDQGLYECDHGFAEYYPVGCGTEWEGFVTCTTNATIDCSTGAATACSAQARAYFQCQSAFVSRTNCELAGPSGMCAANQFSFGCLSGTPAGCTPIDTSSAAMYACCPAFPD
jgi:hypothetical protein